MSFFKKTFIKALTSILWIFISFLICWIFISTIWWLLGKFIYNELFIPQKVINTILTIALSILWILITAIIFKIRSKHIFKVKTKYYQKSCEFVSEHWTSYLSELSCSTENFPKLNNKQIKKHDLSEYPAEYLISYALIQVKKGNIPVAVSILRHLIKDESTPAIIKKASEHELKKLFSVINIEGKNASAKLKEDKKI
ncbi:hypothetical protein Q428_01015 [Fervidicella metallireducens AeB]|uniref:Uncharacterized protein n=1 Tax=Fervidicella metallireducens AeB TaxID=1403537 RepID=A0A017S0K5_9CLOT|nr:hypothetical protein [Fervidicella metallireducens]EYE89715.1 hypothetical protein Q428_01015 [Fervidicella metallireducens AeB]